MAKHPDAYYQRFQKPYCECAADSHGHTGTCRSRRYLVVHHKDHARQDQSKENLITLCSSCHRKEHAKQSHYYGREGHASWAETARLELQRRRMLAEEAEAQHTSQTKEELLNG